MHLRRANARVLDGWLYRNEGWGVLRDRRVFRIFLSSSHALTLNRRTALHSYGVLDASSLAWMSMTRSCAWPGGVGDCLEPPGSHLGRLSKIYSDSTGATDTLTEGDLADGFAWCGTPHELEWVPLTVAAEKLTFNLLSRNGKPGGRDGLRSAR